jgi:hypothetical protein
MIGFNGHDFAPATSGLGSRTVMMEPKMVVPGAGGKQIEEKPNTRSFDSEAHLPLRGMMFRLVAQDDRRLIISYQEL